MTFACHPYAKNAQGWGSLSLGDAGENQEPLDGGPPGKGGPVPQHETILMLPDTAQ